MGIKIDFSEKKTTFSKLQIEVYRHNRIESMHKSKRKLLLHYMRQKSDFLESITNIKLYENFDFTRARRRPYKDIKRIINGMSPNALQSWRHIADGSICPECRLYSGICRKCSYALKHNDCKPKQTFSTYRKIVSCITGHNCPTNERIKETIGQETLRLYFKWNK